MTAAHLLGRFKAADDRSLQANDVNGILDVVASEKQVVDLCFRLRSPLPASHVIDEEFAPDVPIYFKTLHDDLVFLERHEALELTQYVVQRRHGRINRQFV